MVVHTKLLPYKLADLFDLVKDVESYPRFLPWILHSVVYKKTEKNFFADLTLRNPKITYSSFVSFSPFYIQAQSVGFPSVRAEWIFRSCEDKCLVTFRLADFPIFLKVPILSFFAPIMEAFEEEAQRRFSSLIAREANSSARSFPK